MKFRDRFLQWWSSPLPDMKTAKGRLAYLVNHFLIEPSIWALGIYGIMLGILSTYSFGFFTLKEYTIFGLSSILPGDIIQSYYLWYDAYPYSLMIFGSYILGLYFKLRPKGYLALPTFIITYATWDFLGIGANIVKGYSIIWLGIAMIGLIYYFPTRKLTQVNISFIGLIIFFAFGILYLQGIFLTEIPYLQHYPLIADHTIFEYINAILNEGTFCLLCLLSIKLRK